MISRLQVPQSHSKRLPRMHQALCTPQTVICNTSERHTGSRILKGQNLTHQQALTSRLVSRRSVFAAAVAFLAVQSRRAEAASVSPELLKAFQDAIAAQGNYESMESAWTRAVELAPTNSAAYSNRGTARLQFGRWQLAKDDLQQAYALEKGAGGPVNALVLNNLGNAEGALGQWDLAKLHYLEAANDPEMESIAFANFALASFEVGEDAEAIQSARRLLRRDPEFLDMKCALAAFLWGTGSTAAAEAEWESLQQAADGLGGALYSKATAVNRVKSRWPPRASAALTAFLELQSTGNAKGYDGEMHKYNFASAN